MHAVLVVACEFKVYREKKNIKIIFEKHNSQTEKEKENNKHRFQLTYLVKFFVVK